ncbi:MAG: RagB/SusD family nutrient uptake outer membrane protein [Paramuribaculum sp.]|nr:RagB/SusD family nutrient uptake outer membrane protein [Paramuribaculum sp.]
MKKYINILASLAIASSGMFASCSLDLDNPDGPTATGYFNEQDKFVLNMVGITQEWRSDFDINMMRNAGELRSGIYSPVTSGIDGSMLEGIEAVNNVLDAAHPQFTNFANFYGTIGNLNALLYYADRNAGVFNSESARSYLKGMAYGMRAYLYFQLHKMYGTCPLRTEPDVLLGNFNAVALAMPRAEAEAVLNQIKEDVKNSIKEFEAGAGFNDQRVMGKNYWNPTATQMLAGEVYLWSGKVSTGNHKATPADVTTAKGYFEEVTKAGYSMMPNYADVFDAAKKAANTEVIFSTYYGYGVNTANWYFQSFWNPTTGQAQGIFWACYGEDGITPTAYANRLGRYINTEGKQENNNLWYHGPGNVVNRYQYRNAVWYQYNELDTRRDANFMDNYLATNEENGVQADGETPIEGASPVNFIADFNKNERNLAGLFFFKYKGELQNSNLQGTNDMIYYRLPLAYMYLAEIANYEGNNSDVEKYINMVRKRAYADNWDEAALGYKAGSFRENEVAILQEKTREFVGEGQRWWDIRRLTTVKDGEDKDHLLFQPESCAGFGLDATNPYYNEVCLRINDLPNCPLVTNVPVLDYATQKQMALWPINTALVSDVVLQTPGY